MKRTRLISAIVLLLLTAAVVGAQSPQPTGMLSSTNPVLFTHDGVPDGIGDLPATIQLIQATSGPNTVLVDLGSNVCFDTSSFPLFAMASQTGMPLDEFMAGSGEVMMGPFDTSDSAHPRPIGADYDEGQRGTSNGMAMLLDADGDHRYERMEVMGTKGGNPVSALLDLQFHDNGGAPGPDFVTLFDPAAVDPEANLAVLQFFGLFCSSPAQNFDQVWIPLARDLQADPAIIFDIVAPFGQADTQAYWGPKFEGAVSVLEIPTLSELGLVTLVLALLFVSLRLMRRRRLEAGA